MTKLSATFLRTGTSLLLAASLLTGRALADSEAWLSDLGAAKKLAAEKKLDILMNFTGSDW